MIYIGIDPGLSGAMAVIDDTAEFPENPRVQVFDTPTLIVAGDKNKRVYNKVAMAQLLQPYSILLGAINAQSLVVLESVHAMPKQGVTSSFSFGRGLGIWEGIIAALSLPLEMPSPQRWKKEMMADQGKDKDAARYKAMSLFPSLTEQLKLVKHDGRAEALLMAEYARRLRK